MVVNQSQFIRDNRWKLREPLSPFVNDCAISSLFVADNVEKLLLDGERGSEVTYGKSQA